LLLVFAEQAARRGIEMTAVSLGDDQDLTFVDALRNLGVKTESFPAPKLWSPSRLLALTRFIRSGGFDLVHTHLSYANIIGTLAGRLSGIPVVSSIHSTSPGDDRSNQVREWLELFCLRFLAFRVIAVAHKVQEAYRPLLKGKPIDVIPNAVPAPAQLSRQERKDLRRELTGDPSRPILITVGRFAPPKAYDDLITAFDALLALQPEAVLVMVGDGPLFQQIEGLISERGLSNRVRLLGMRQDVPRLLAASDVYVSSSIREGLPMAVLEAMMAGLPIVATDAGDISRLVLPQAGFIVPPQNPVKLAGALDSLLRTPDRGRGMGEAARNVAKEKFSAAAWMDKLAGLYADVLQRPVGVEREAYV
jgi:glycosyltransferase involved in cell wall biosynthesis